MGDKDDNQEKKYIQITTEDYELALAGKVVQKSHKMIIGVVLLIATMFAFFGIKYSIDINQVKKSLEEGKEELELRELEYKKIESDLKSKIMEFEVERKFTEDFYDKISTSFGMTSNSMFTSFINSTSKNLSRLNEIERDVLDAIKEAKENTTSIQNEIGKARNELADNRQTLDELKTIAAETDIQKQAIEDLINDFTNKFSFQPLVVSIGNTEYSDLLQIDVSYLESSSRRVRKQDRIIRLGDSLNGDKYKLGNLPKTFTNSDGVIYSLELAGNYNDETIVLKINRQ